LETKDKRIPKRIPKAIPISIFQCKASFFIVKKG